MNSPLYGQVNPSELDYPHNHLPWFTVESDHFLVHYQEGSSRAAQVASVVAEEIYEPVTTLYGHRPGRKVSIVLRDREDYSNGAAYFHDDKIEIWVPALDTPLRGTHRWLQNVITHEFTHLVQIGASMKRTQRIPAVYFQWLTYEDIRRPDILYGFPNGIITLPFASVSIPAWFAEGTAQFQRNELNHDNWDSHRDMILRTRILSDTHLQFDEMASFTSKNSLERELVYNQGYDFTRYLTDRFGEEIIAIISETASNSKKNNFNTVLEIATGLTGEQLFLEWEEFRKSYYHRQISDLSFTGSVPVVETGFLNFYPQFNKNETLFAYLTNGTRDNGQTTLIIAANGDTVEVDQPGGLPSADQKQNYKISHGLESNPSIEYVGNRFSFSPDGKRIAYNRNRKNRYGETYSDIHIYDVTSNEKKKITESARILDPAWHPFNQQIAAVQRMSDTQNLVMLNTETGQIRNLTRFQNGETVYTPVWSPDGSAIYFAIAFSGNRNIFRYHTESGDLEPLFSNPEIDYRDPWYHAQTDRLYFSSDITGIFNIYRTEPTTGRMEQVTNVPGGAFMPFVKSDSLYFSEYKHDGYKISKISLQDNASLVPENQLQVMQSIHNDTLSGYDLDIRELDPDTDSGKEIHIVINEDNHEERYWRPYHETTTGLSIFPVVRFDNYSTPRGRYTTLIKNAELAGIGENMWRDFKAGAYFSSRDVTESLSIFGGIMLGPGSVPADGLSDFISPTRLNNLDRDLFLIIDHRGLPFIKRSWSPTVSVEFYNMKRNVKNGLTVEEFPCTSCLPTERSVDIRYDMWEANLFLRSKLNRWSFLELGATYSPYRVNTEGFFSEEFKEFIPGSTSEYFRGFGYSASYIADATQPDRHRDIAPAGIKANVTYRYQPGRLLQEFEVSDGTLSPVYSKDRNHSFEFRQRTGMRLSSTLHTMFTTRAFAYLNNPGDYFYLDYTGGLGGMRSYPYFAVGGLRSVFGRISLLHPLYESMSGQVGAYTPDKLFAHIFFETGNGWGGPLNTGRRLKTGAGAEFRFAFNSYYLFPMKFFVNTTYGFNRFSVTLPSEFISEGEGNTVRYGREFLFYFGITFDFDVL